MRCILTEELAGEWISDGLTESRVTEIATFQIPSKQLEAYPIREDSHTAQDASKFYI
jgi:hypothetical protein